MTITYPNGAVLEAILLSRSEDELRATVAGCDDVLVFTRIFGYWISEDSKPVTIKFEWQRRAAAHVPAEEDCICPKELAGRLVSMLQDGSDPERVKPRVFAASAFASEKAN